MDILQHGTGVEVVGPAELAGGRQTGTVRCARAVQFGKPAE